MLISFQNVNFENLKFENSGGDMGLTGGLVKSVFSKNRSVGSHDTSIVRNYGMDKRRWSTVRSYLCGDEFNSVLADADSASITSSITQPVGLDLSHEGDIQSEPKQEQILQENSNSVVALSSQENAAIVIQLAFRRFLARRSDRVTKKRDEGKTLHDLQSPSWESVGTSIEVQTGGSAEVLALHEERVSAQHRGYQKARSQMAKLKEDWDDSTVSSNISKLRIQSRLEASTRRERALAYAFSQQLRICSKKKPTQSEMSEVNMGWNWLERWMATRPADAFSVEDRMSKQNEPMSRDPKFVLGKKNFDVAAEEKESCASNDVYVGIDRLVITAPNDKDKHKPTKNRLKAAKNVSRRKTVPSYQISAQWMKETKKDCSKEAENDKKHKQAQQAWSASEVKQTVTSPDSSAAVTSFSSK